MNAAEPKTLAKLPPQNIEAEKALLGAALIDPDALGHVIEKITGEDFYLKSHQIIYEALLGLYEKNEPTDVLTATNYLEKKEKLNEIGGASYLAGLTDAMPTTANVLAYAKIVAEKSVLRKLIQGANHIAQKSYQGKDEAYEVLDEAEKIIYDISENRGQKGFTAIRDLVKDSFKHIEELFENKKPITGLATGFDDFDNLSSGLQKNDLVILAGRPSMGKTALALNIAENAALKENAKVALFSLEMAKEQLVTRMLCSQARIDSSKLRRGELVDNDWPELTRVASLLSDASIYIDDSAAPSVLEMRAKARRLKREQGLDLVIVDYLQLIRSHANLNSREQEISEISRSLKSLAKEFNVPVVALSQLNRSLEGRQNKRPQLSDLRESGAIEQDADLIAFVYRDEVYNQDTPDKGIAELIIGKQRNGPTGTVRVAFLNQFTRFENLAFEPDEEFTSEFEEEPSPF